MDFITWLIFFLIQNGVLIGYPVYQILKNKEDPKEKKLWIMYFFFIGLLGILEGTVLFPIIYM